MRRILRRILRRSPSDVWLARVFLAGLAALAIVTAASGRSASEARWLPCPVDTAIGLPCPGCGMTRACVSAASGDVAGAWALHPFALPLLALALLFAFFRDPAARVWARVPARVRAATWLLLLGLVLVRWGATIAA